MTTKHHSRKRRQLAHLSKKLSRLIAARNQFYSSEIERLKLKIFQILQQLKGLIAFVDLKKALGAAALFFTFSVNSVAQAQSFGAVQLNPFNLKTKAEMIIPAVTDIDGDGDLDLLSGSYGGEFIFHKNVGTKENPNYARQELNPFSLTSSYDIAFPTLADLDNDGDLDMLAGEYEGVLKYYENVGTKTNPSFSRGVANPFGIDTPSYISAPQLVDLDGDGDFDLLVGLEDGDFGYYENVGTKANPIFDNKKVNPFGLVPSYYFAFPTLADLDKDGDLDMLVGEYYANFTYYENTGSKNNPKFESPLENPFGLVQCYNIAFPAFADLDNDGDMDVLVAEYYGNFKYFENGKSASTSDVSKTDQVTISPNPTSNVLNLTFSQTPSSIELYNLMGQKVFSSDIVTNQISLSEFAAGTYSLRVIYADGSYSVHKVAKFSNSY